MLKEIQDCFRSERILFTRHARDEMENEEFGEIREREVFEAVAKERLPGTYLSYLRNEKGFQCQVLT
jgi:hypothetical protein